GDYKIASRGANFENRYGIAAGVVGEIKVVRIIGSQAKHVTAGCDVEGGAVGHYSHHIVVTVEGIYIATVIGGYTRRIGNAIGYIYGAIAAGGYLNYSP